MREKENTLHAIQDQEATSWSSQLIRTAVRYVLSYVQVSNDEENILHCQKRKKYDISIEARECAFQVQRRQTRTDEFSHCINVDTDPNT